jgi:phosphoribosyl 1,2-cyclic phosphodiesterase
VLGSGSAGNATLVRRGKTALLVDAGLSARELARRLERCEQDPAAVTALIVSHEHGDHVRGAAVFSRRHQVPVFCSSASREAAGRQLADLAAWEPLEAGRTVDLGDLQTTPFPIPHDAACTFGFVVAGGGLRVGLATDLGHVNRLVTERLREAQVQVVEMNHDPVMVREGPYPWPVKQRVLSRHGHLSNEAGAGLLPRTVGQETRAVFLAHISQTNNDHDLALTTARQAVDGGRFPHLDLLLTYQDRPSTTVRL